MDVNVNVVANGPLKVEGEIHLFKSDHTGLPTAAGKDVYLCRCGQSAKKPFCDGSHARVGFKAD